MFNCNVRSDAALASNRNRVHGVKSRPDPIRRSGIKYGAVFPLHTATAFQCEICFATHGSKNRRYAIPLPGPAAAPEILTASPSPSAPDPSVRPWAPPAR